MPFKSGQTKRALVPVVVGLLCLLYSGQAAAYTILLAAAGNPNSWMVLCDSGQMTGPYAGLASANSAGGAHCASGGGGGGAGIADFTDLEILNALEQPCVLPSNFTVGRDTGGGLRALGAAELQAILDATGGVPQELEGLELMSLVVRGTELHPDPSQGPAPIAVNAVYSNENGDGSYVGGSCNCAAVPISGTTSILISLTIAGLGLWTIKRRSLVAW